MEGACSGGDNKGQAITVVVLSMTIIERGSQSSRTRKLRRVGLLDDVNSTKEYV
jgi:hypothetical protein